MEFLEFEMKSHAIDHPFWVHQATKCISTDRMCLNDCTNNGISSARTHIQTNNGIHSSQTKITEIVCGSIEMLPLHSDEFWKNSYQNEQLHFGWMNRREMPISGMRIVRIFLFHLLWSAEKVRKNESVKLLRSIFNAVNYDSAISHLSDLKRLRVTRKKRWENGNRMKYDCHCRFTTLRSCCSRLQQTIRKDFRFKRHSRHHHLHTNERSEKRRNKKKRQNNRNGNGL